MSEINKQIDETNTPEPWYCEFTPLGDGKVDIFDGEDKYLFTVKDECIGFKIVNRLNAFDPGGVVEVFREAAIAILEDSTSVDNRNSLVKGINDMRALLEEK